ncbi:hypothetical protein GGD56_001044 [Rhizobium mongolense]|uniref:Uncharacterized protein n=2 Tax=Rhizobium mongolense TaxID=57676 RepID=A0ABR6II32_9HYPH|nr:hypothetical protein [Rhizobium mongolense]TVZ74389.1 hypothetical protein BCL32_2765 [Rhizobium mongolense USDA 1844]
MNDYFSMEGPGGVGRYAKRIFRMSALACVIATTNRQLSQQYHKANLVCVARTLSDTGGLRRMANRQDDAQTGV